MICDDARLLLHAYLDDELDAAQSAAMQRHLQTCSPCAASYGDYQRLRKALAQPGLYRTAPASLRQPWTSDKVAPARTRSFARAWPAAAGFVIAGLLGGALWLGSGRQDAGSLANEAISAHLRSLQLTHLMDVVSTDQHTVKPWFEGKLDFSPRVKELAGEGFPLAGGRLDAIDGHSVAALIYRRRLHVINLYQWPTTAIDTTPHVTERNGYTVIDWNNGGMRFLAVSDVNGGELRQFVLAFQNSENLR
ncbi:MAG TPA: anti-sigma factor [Dyella sp.]|uniref:anti-sigma factor family protein n=1 Tax=Dyella sp. TaxID=1869338 RepID=UPI002F926566